ncbi:hypothetical protein BWR15_26975 [Pseudomonas sp. T]|nr:hypothetical protein BWR15_26975 [Pseudomonas sp. T]
METSEDKTKRKYLHLLDHYVWGYQYSIFYQDVDQSIDLLEDMKPFKQRLIRVCPDQPFLLRIQLLNRLGRKQAYLSILTTKRSKELEQAHESYWPSSDTRCLGRRLKQSKLDQISKAIATQRPHNLPAFFNVSRVRRYALLNADHLQVVETESE